MTNQKAMKQARERIVSKTPTKPKALVNSLTYDWRSQPGEKTSLPSLTRPDMALTIPEIMQRYASGRSVNLPVYDDFSGDHDHLTGLDLRTLDISEVHDLLEQTRTNLENLNTERNRRSAEAQRAALEKSIIEKHEARKSSENVEKLPPPKFIQTSIPIAKEKDQ